jgi:hypothetical protein
MGYLTPILFSNDAYDQFKKNPEETTKNILAAMDSREDQSYGVGNHCNPMDALATRHADEHSVIVFWGNTWFDLTRSTIDELYPPQKMRRVSTENLERLLSLVEEEAKRLKKVLKKRKENEQEG